MRTFACLLLLLLVATAVPARADEGLWTFDNVPRATIRQACGVSLDDAWLKHVQLSCARVGGGCSGSFISADGLVLTNHHCAQEGIANLSSPGHDLFATGFVARTRAAELAMPDYHVDELVVMVDVTAKVNAATAGLDDQHANEARKRVLSQLELAAEQASRHDAKTGPLLCQSVTLYGGGQYMLYEYKRYDDVRLVFAPELGIAGFGGDPDNFQFPRWDLDMALLRVYEHGAPAHIANFLAMDFAGPADGEPVFVAGHPGASQRLLTADQLQTIRDVDHPLRMLIYSELRGRLLQFSKQGDAQASVAMDALLDIENSLKAYRGELDALHDDAQLAAKRTAQSELLARVAGDTAEAGALSRAYADIATAERLNRQAYVRRYFLEKPGWWTGSLFGWSKHLVRGTVEREKPNEQRLREYASSALPDVESSLEALQPVHPELERLELSLWFERMREYLGPSDPAVQALMGGDSPDTLAARLVNGTALADTAVRAALWRGGAQAVAASNDPFIVFMRRLDPFARAERERYEKQVESPVTHASERIAHARFAAYGTKTYPDATGTLRLNHGRVQGWNEKGQDIAPFTTLRTLHERATGQDWFTLPASWTAAWSKLDPATPFNYCTTNDILGGNSGSPVIDAHGRLVGLVFDGNFPSLAGYYWFDLSNNRTVAVHPAAIREALDKVYAAPALVKEIAGVK